MISAIFGMTKMVPILSTVDGSDLSCCMLAHTESWELLQQCTWLSRAYIACLYSVPPRFRNLSKPSLLSIVLSHHLLQCSFMVGGNIGNLSIGYQRTLPVHCALYAIWQKIHSFRIFICKTRNFGLNEETNCHNLEIWDKIDSSIFSDIKKHKSYNHKFLHIWLDSFLKFALLFNNFKGI